MGHILLVDDDDMLVAMYRTKFEHRGYNIDIAKDGEDALAQLSRSRPNLILLDIMMPKIDGLQVLKTIKENKELHSIPVVLLTNVGNSQDDIERGLKLGAVTYLIKTDYTPTEVVEKVEEILKGYLHKPHGDIPDVKVTVKNIRHDAVKH